MGYIKESELFTAIPNQYNQVFAYSNYIFTSKQGLVEMKITGEISNTYIHLLEFLYTKNFATKQQLIRLCKMYNYFKSEPFLIEKILEKMVDLHLINRFYLDEEEIMEPRLNFPGDALTIYCLATGGFQLLDNYSAVETFGWDNTCMCKASALISKELVATQFYLQLLETAHNRLRYFRIQPNYTLRSAKKMMGSQAGFDFMIENPDEKRYFIVDVFRTWDTPDFIRDKILLREALLTTKTWMGYYADASKTPNYIVCADNEQTLQYIANEIEENAKIKFSCWYTTDALLNTSFNEQAFLKYEKGYGTFTPVKVKVFMG